VNPPRDQHGEHPVTPCDSLPDNLAVVRSAGDFGDAPFERVELPDALLAAHANHLVAPVKRVLRHVLPSLPKAPTMQTFIRELSPSAQDIIHGTVTPAKQRNRAGRARVCGGYRSARVAQTVGAGPPSVCRFWHPLAGKNRTRRPPSATSPKPGGLESQEDGCPARTRTSTN
jgi:hypothetical protein